MENLLIKQSIRTADWGINCTEECGIVGDFTLPEYCPDVASVLKCILTPRIQSRHWTGERFVVDGIVVVRVLYLDEDRCRVNSAEFTLPFSCTLTARCAPEMVPVIVNITTKYVNCRPVTPRRFEVRGAISISAKAECVTNRDVTIAVPNERLHTKCEREMLSLPLGMIEKVVTISESLSFPDAHPPAEMLLGGDVRVDVRECRWLMGKVIVKGNLYIHQLYTDSIEKGSTHCLDFVLPYSQILDVDGCTEDILGRVHVSVLSDTERYAVGPDGENTMLEITVKLLMQAQIYEKENTDVLLDAFHSDYPTTCQFAEEYYCNYLGTRYEDTVLPMQIPLHELAITELLDVWMTPLDNVCDCLDGSTAITGKLAVCILLRDRDGQVAYAERVEEYRLEFSGMGNVAEADITVGEIRYRVVNHHLEAQINLSVVMRCYNNCCQRAVCDLQVRQDAPFHKSKANLKLFYAQGGESVWDVARDCHTSPEGIADENHLESDVFVRPTLLVVPIR